jgi:hypothetical protein
MVNNEESAEAKLQRVRDKLLSIEAAIAEVRLILRGEKT